MIKTNVSVTVSHYVQHVMSQSHALHESGLVKGWDVTKLSGNHINHRAGEMERM